MIDWLNTAVFTLFGAPTTWAEILGFITGAVTVWLVAKQNILNWPIGIANNLLWILLFTTAGLYADGALQVVYIVLALWGWWNWLYGGAERTLLHVSRTTGEQWAYLVVIGFVATTGMAWFLDTYTGSTVPFFDAVTTVISLLAVWGQIKKKIESWYLWMLADVIYVPLYVYKGLTLTAILYVGFFALCVVGLVKWRKELNV
jgi:nicotinamide mononucleotide transporter